MKALRADSGLNMLAATVQVGRDSTWRNCSQACDITGPPLPLESYPQSNRTPDLFSRDLHRVECLSLHFLPSVFWTARALSASAVPRRVQCDRLTPLWLR